MEPINKVAAQPVHALPMKIEQNYIKCCVCGTEIPPNTVNMCGQCFSSRVDITEGIMKSGILQLCKQCDRYMKPPWIKCAPESSELLSLCLSKVRGLHKSKMVDASFIWTESHCKRIKIKVTVQKEVMSSVVEQSFIVEFKVENLQCDDCKKIFTPHLWSAAVQVRQKVEHKRTIMFLEQLILKHDAHAKALNVKEFDEGMDFYFAHKTHALILADFIQNYFPIKMKPSKQLISVDDNSNIANYKYTYFIEIAPLCKDDLCLIPKVLRKELGGVSPIMLVVNINTMITLWDPIHTKFSHVDSANYWKYEIKALCSRSKLTPFIILKIEKEGETENDSNTSRHTHSKERTPCDKADVYNVEVQRQADFGNTMETFLIRTSVENLKPMDHVLCYDLVNLNIQEVEEIEDKSKVPDIVIAKRFYPNRKKGKSRIWKLKEIEKETDANKAKQDKAAKDKEEFMEMLEEEPQERKKINLYKDEEVISKMMNKLNLEEKKVGPAKEEEKKEEVKKQEKEEEKSITKPRKAKRLTKRRQNMETNSKLSLQMANQPRTYDDDDFPGVKLEELMSDLKI